MTTGKCSLYVQPDESNKVPFSPTSHKGFVIEEIGAKAEFAVDGAEP